MTRLNEADTRAKLIDPKLKAAGWGENQIEREHYFLRGKAFTAGRIYLVGEESHRRQPRRADYLLRLHNALPIAVLEAKDESQTADAGLEQAKAYALQQGPFRTNWDGRFRFTRLPAGTIRLPVGGAGYRRRQVSVEAVADTVQNVTIELKPETGPVGKIEVQGLTVTIADEATFLVESSGEQLTLEQYLDYTRKKVVGYVPDWARLHEVWTDPAKREPFLESLEAESIHIEVLAEVLAQPRADQFDLLAYIAFGKPIRTCDERADAFLNYEQRFLEKYDPKAREVILALLDKYRLAGVAEMASSDIFRLSPFREMGQAPGVIQRFGGTEPLRTVLGEMQRRLYRKEAI